VDRSLLPETWPSAMLPTHVKILQILFCGFETGRTDLSACIAGFHFRADKNAECCHLIAPLLAKTALSQSALSQAI
jgi:hypothetical protein